MPLFVPSIVDNDCVQRAAAFVVHLQNLRLFRVRIITWQHKSVACQQAHTKHTQTNWLAAAHQCSAVQLLMLLLLCLCLAHADDAYVMLYESRDFG